MSETIEGQKLKELGTVTTASTQKGDPLAEPNTPYIGLEHIERDLGIINGRGTAAEVRSTKSVFRKGDLLYGKLRSYLNKVWVAQFDGMCSTDILVYPKTDAVENAFLKYRFMTRDFVSYASENSNGVNLPRVNAKALARFPIWFPTLPEQQRIVAEIEKQFTRLEAGVAALRRVQANLKRYRAAVLKAACEGRLVPTEAELNKSGSGVPPLGLGKKRQDAASTFETGEDLLARILTERRKNWQGRGKYKEPAAPDTTNLPELPGGWTYVAIEMVGFVQLGRQRAPKHHKGANMRPYLRVANVYEDKIDLSDVKEMNFTPAEFEVFRLEPNDILLNEGQSLELVGRAALYRGELPGACFTNTIVRFRPCPSLNVKFALSVFRAFMHSGRFQKIANWTTNIAHLGADRFAKLAFPLPPLAEQTRIVAEVERRLSVVEELEAAVSANLQRATRLRQSILKMAFSGALLIPSE